MTDTVQTPTLLDRVIAVGIPKAAATTFLEKLGGERVAELEATPAEQFYSRAHSLRSLVVKETIGDQIKGQPVSNDGNGNDQEIPNE